MLNDPQSVTKVLLVTEDAGFMVNLASMLVEPQQIIDFLGRDLQLKAVCQEIVQQQIIHQASQTHNITVSPAEIQAEVDRFCTEQHLTHPAALQAWLDTQMITLQNWQLGIRDRLLVAKLAEHLFAESAQQFFEQHQTDFDQILLYKITVPYESLALELFYKIEEEEMSFYEAAHLYNVSESSRLYCGCEGRKYRGELKSEVSALISDAAIGQVIGPILTAEATYNLLLIEAFMPAEFTGSIREEIIQKLFREWLDNELSIYLN